MKTEAEIKQRLEDIEIELKRMSDYDPKLDSILGERKALEWVLGLEEN